MNCNVSYKHIKELLKTDITQIPNYIGDVIRDNPDNNYVELCNYIVKKHNSFIKELEDGLQNYIKERQKIHDLVSGMLDSNVVSFTTALNMIYYLNKDIKNIQIDNTRIMAFLDTLKDMNKRKDN